MASIDVIRLCLASVFLTLAALAVVSAPTYFLWKVTIGVTECGHAFALGCLAAMWLLGGNSRSAKVAMGMCALATGLALTPILRASLVARQLPDRCRAAFGTATPGVPIAFEELFRGIRVPAVSPTRLIYRESEQGALVLDFYPAAAVDSAPLVVTIHGGSWRGGNNTDFVTMDRYLASHGFAVADITYRLAPASPFPAASDDVRSVLAFVRSRADSLRIDPERIVLLGRSAGGQIALDVAYSARDPAIRGVIAFYPPTDLRWSWDHPGNPLIVDTRGVLIDFLGGGPAQRGMQYVAASPIHHVTPESPPTLLLYGVRDELVSKHHSEELERRLVAAGVPHLQVRLPWATHGFDYVTGGPGNQISAYAILSFLSCVTSPGVDS